jgi:hypothetical protein
MNLLSEAQALARLNAALARVGASITRGTFAQSVRPQMEIRGDAQAVGQGRRASWVYDPARFDDWCEYLAVRQVLIQRGAHGWHSKRPYDVLECEAIAQGNAHGDVVAELFPQQAQP